MLETIDHLLTHYSQWLYYLAIFSAVILVASIFFIPIVIARIPADYFVAPQRSYSWETLSWYRLSLTLFRNVLGSLLILAGIAMLILPGQGILTVLAGLFVLDFPGKYKIERYLVRQPAVLNSLNWIRRRRNIPDLRVG